LKAQGHQTVVLEIDSSQVETLRKFGFKVFYGDALRLDLLEAAGAAEAKLLIIAIDEPEKVTELIKTAKQHFPHLKLLARAFDRAHAHDVLREGVDNVYREVFGSSMDMAQDALIALGKPKAAAERAITQFRNHDENFLRKAAPLAGDQAKLIDLARQSRAEIANVFAQDRADQPKEEA
jgi:voltage-gated potassium channel Kch